MLTGKQLAAVRWYIGDVQGDDLFWGDPKAYLPVNSLFFEGIGTERNRADEGKFLNPAILEDSERLADTLRSLLDAFLPLEEETMTCRVERFADYQAIRQQGRTVSFTSTSTAGFLPAYQNRYGIALMRFRLPEGTPCISMADVLPHYAKPDESEVLLPPRLCLVLTEQLLSAQEMCILDADGTPPAVSVMAVPDRWECSPAEESPLKDGNLAGMRVLDALNHHTEPDAKDVTEYICWKAAFTAGLWR